MTEPQLDSHYQQLGPIQPIDAIRGWSHSWGAHAYYLGNIVKYAARMFTKGTPQENLSKIRFYVTELERALGPDGGAGKCGRIHFNSPSDPAWVCTLAAKHVGLHCDGVNSWKN
jgi:hypothetical protein